MKDPWARYQTNDPRPWVDPNGNRHSRRTKKFDTPKKYIAHGCRWEPRAQYDRPNFGDPASDPFIEQRGEVRE